MKINANLVELERQLSLCIKCRQCTYSSWPKNLPTCPINDQYSFFTYSGGGLIYLARGILLGLIEKDRYKEVLGIASKCTQCNYCGKTCELVKVAPPYQNVTDLIRLLKIYLVKNGFYLSDEHKDKIMKIRQTKNRAPYLAVEGALKEHKRSSQEKGSLLIFSGCLTSHENNETLNAVAEILNKAGVDYRFMENEWCCGSPLLDLGDADGIRELAEHNLKAIKKRGASKVVFLCPHCQETFRTAYPEIIGKSLEFEPVFVSKYIADLIDEGAVKPVNSLSKTISYHDPCYLGRYLGDFHSGRRILSKIPDMRLVEMQRNKEDSYCCGAGGGANLLDPQNSFTICRERIRDFKKADADVLVTSCPLCKSHFRETSRTLSEGIIVKDVVEVLRDSIH